MVRERPDELMSLISYIKEKSHFLNPTELDFIDEMDSKGCIGISIKQEEWITDLFDRIYGGC